MADTRLYKVAITPCGKYVHGTEYDTLCLVLNATEDGGDGCAYLSVKRNKNIRPGTDDTVWKKSIERGEKGDTGDAGSVYLSGDWGDGEDVGMTQKALSDEHIAVLGMINNIISGETQIRDYALNLTQAEINQMVVSGNITVSLSASPSTVFVGSQYTISLSASSNRPATSITIKKDSTQISTGSGTSLSGSDTITPGSSGNTSYSAEFIVNGITKTASRSVAAVYPIRIGTGTEYVDGTPLSSPKTSPAGTYNVTVANNGEYIYFNVPSTMTINGATMGGFAFPLESSQSKSIGGVSYKSYRSSNTYDAGTLTIVIS